MKVTKDGAIRMARTVLENGKPYEAAWYDDGDAESGPSGGRNFGMKWGRLRLEFGTNGSVYLFTNRYWQVYGMGPGSKAKDDQFHVTIYSSSGWGHKPDDDPGKQIRDELDAKRKTFHDDQALSSWDPCQR